MALPERVQARLRRYGHGFIEHWNRHIGAVVEQAEADGVELGPGPRRLTTAQLRELHDDLVFIRQRESAIEARYESIQPLLRRFNDDPNRWQWEIDSPTPTPD